MAVKASGVELDCARRVRGVSWWTVHRVNLKCSRVFSSSSSSFSSRRLAHALAGRRSRSRSRRRTRRRLSSRASILRDFGNIFAELSAIFCSISMRSGDPLLMTAFMSSSGSTLKAETRTR